MCVTCEWEIKGPYIHYRHMNRYYHKTCYASVLADLERLTELRERFTVVNDDPAAAIISRLIRAVQGKLWPK